MITIGIKTFMRPECLARAVESVRAHYPDWPILVIDDGPEPAPLAGVRHVVTRYDVGLAEGRNKMLRLARTPRIFIADDDMIFTRDTDIPAMARAMEEGGFDIVGLSVIDVPTYKQRPHCYSVWVEGEAGHSETEDYPEEAGCRVCGFVENGFLARVESLKRVWWDPELKLHEHGDFFLRAKGLLKVGWHETAQIHHQHVAAPEYVPFRRGDRAKGFARRFFEKWGVRRWESSVMGVPQWAKTLR